VEGTWRTNNLLTAKPSTTITPHSSVFLQSCGTGSTGFSSKVSKSSCTAISSGRTVCPQSCLPAVRLPSTQRYCSGPAPNSQSSSDQVARFLSRRTTAQAMALQRLAVFMIEPSLTREGRPVLAEEEDDWIMSLKNLRKHGKLNTLRIEHFGPLSESCANCFVDHWRTAT